MPDERTRDLMLTLLCSVPAPLCLLSLLLPLSPAAPISPAEPISQAYSLALYMQKNTSTLLQTYVSDIGHMQGSGGGGQAEQVRETPLCEPEGVVALSLRKPKEGIGSPGIKESCRLPRGCRESNPCSLHVCCPGATSCPGLAPSRWFLDSLNFSERWS